MRQMSIGYQTAVLSPSWRQDTQGIIQFKVHLDVRKKVSTRMLLSEILLETMES